MKRAIKIFPLIVIISLMFPSGVYSQNLQQSTWVGTDALGRKMPTSEETGPIKTDKSRTVGMFYVTWHMEELFKYPSGYKNVTEVLESDPDARIHSRSKAWPKGVRMWHWGEPESGYFLSQDKYVIRHDMSMLSDAGVDVLIMDLTNAVEYWDEWKAVFDTMEEMKAEGNQVPKFCFWTFNDKVITVTQHIYERIYKAGKYKDLWFYWEGKPLLLCNMDPSLDANAAGLKDKEYSDYTDEVKEFFTRRNMWWGYYEWGGKRYVGTEDNWCFGYSMDDPHLWPLGPHGRAATHKGRYEEMAVTPAQHPASGTGKSWSLNGGQPALNEYDLSKEAYVPWLGKTVKNPEHYGIYFQDRWDEALLVDPDFIYINDWNEWTAGKYPIRPGEAFLWRKENDFWFVDQYNSEFNRTIQPVKGMYTDNYYMQMAQNIRRYKGTEPIPENTAAHSISIDGCFSDWDGNLVSYWDTRGDIVHRDHNGYAGRHYVNDSGRNDIIESKVAFDGDCLFFYVKAASALTSFKDHNWMLLLLDSDVDSDTGWYGYDYIVNFEVKNSKKTTLRKYDTASGKWVHCCNISYRADGAELELAVPADKLGVGGERIVMDFKWADNPKELADPISLCTDGDSAPNRRFNYRYIWNAVQDAR